MKEFDALQTNRAFQNALAEAGLMGSYKGQPTMDARRLAMTAANAQRTATEREKTPSQILQERAFENYMRGEATTDDRVILGLESRPSARGNLMPWQTEQSLGPEPDEMALNEMKNEVDVLLSMGTSKEQIEAGIMARSQELMDQGVSVSELLTYLDKRTKKGIGEKIKVALIGWYLPRKYRSKGLVIPLQVIGIALQSRGWCVG